MIQGSDIRKMSIEEVITAYAVAFSRQQVANVCRKWGSKLWLPEGSKIDGPKLLWAIAGCESSFGVDCAPRHESAYCTGRYSTHPEVVALTAEYGHAAHCSFGPWQTLLLNVEAFGPHGLLIGGNALSPDAMIDCETAALKGVGFINRNILRREKAQTVAEIADAYNSGDWRDRYRPLRYIRECVSFYHDEVMPPAAA